MTEKICGTCAHFNTEPHLEPCVGCGRCGGGHNNWQAVIVAKDAPVKQDEPSGGAMLRGKNYYQVAVPEPMNPELKAYTAECADIIEALGMTFNEGEAFKALWRGAAARTLGIVKNTAQYDADKAAHYGQRVAVQVRRVTLVKK